MEFRELRLMANRRYVEVGALGLRQRKEDVTWDGNRAQDRSAWRLGRDISVTPPLGTVNSGGHTTSSVYPCSSHYANTQEISQKRPSVIYTSNYKELHKEASGGTSVYGLH